VENTVATGVIPIDTTGLPPGATFGVATSVGTVGVPADTIEVAVTVRPTRIGRPKSGGPLIVGQAFGPRYHIINLLGIGGMGAVYQAWDAELSVAVALKVIRTDARHPDSSEAEKRLKQELLLARQVTHKHVVRIHDIGEIDGIKYITMPYIQGDDLAKELRTHGKLPVARALRFARHIAAGLHAAHDAGVVHRDLKPANVMVSGSGDDPQALIMDFGISASTDQAASGAVLGTLEYMAPEQAASGTVDGRADIYAFGLILYEMLTGPRMIAGATPQARVDAMTQRFAEGLVPIRALDAALPEPLESFVMRCLENDPAARFQTSTELVGALSQLDDAGARIRVAARLTKPVMAAAAAVVLLLLGGTYLTTRRLLTPPKAHDPVPVLITDFDNRSGDPVFGGSIEQALAVALEQASYITVFKDGDARAVAARLTADKSTRLTQEVGQLIARREGIKVIVSGRIERQATGYRLDLQALDPANVGQPIAAVSQTADNKDQVVRTIASMAASVRVALGESQTEMAKLAAAETVTASSLDAMGAYARAQQLSRANKIQEALEAYQEAVRFDPQFGRAYAGLGSIYSNYFKQPDKAEANYQIALKYLNRMTEREKYRTLGTYYLNVARNYEKAIETYETLVRSYPADDVGHGNLALAYLHVANVARAVAEERTALAIYPRNSLQRYNYAMYTMYAGDFATSIAEASRLLQENPTFEYPLLPLALSRLSQGDEAGARDAYTNLAVMSPVGASLSKLGVADLEMYFGRDRNAIALLQDGIAADRAQGRSSRLAQKLVALSEAYLAVGDRRQAAEAAAEAVKSTRRESTLFPAARVLMRAGREAQALEVVRDLENMLQRHTTAYARLITGEIAAEHGRVGAAVDAFREAQKRHDSWFARLLLGKAYVEAGHFAEAHAELELCIKRRGEAADVFFDDMPTLRYLPETFYWLGRAQEGLGATKDAAKSYEQFLSFRRDRDTRDPLTIDARRRVSSH
jgi:tetratricopeptide (TPR) repeat protein